MGSGNGFFDESAFVSADHQQQINNHPAPLPQPQEQHHAPAVDYSRMISTLNEWRKILNARLLALLALSGSIFGFGFCMYDPTQLRLGALAVYAILVQAPVLLVALRKG